MLMSMIHGLNTTTLATQVVLLTCSPLGKVTWIIPDMDFISSTWPLAAARQLVELVRLVNSQVLAWRTRKLPGSDGYDGYKPKTNK